MTDATEPQPQPEASIERRDRYTIVVNGHAIRATDSQERQLRAMDAEAVARFLKIMGRQ